jgi:hypothetical protein
MTLERLTSEIAVVELYAAPEGSTTWDHDVWPPITILGVMDDQVFDPAVFDAGNALDTGA